MTLQIVIDLANAAFEGDACGPEVARMLRRVADDVEHSGKLRPQTVPLRDCNGNTCGRATVR